MRTRALPHARCAASASSGKWTVFTTTSTTLAPDSAPRDTTVNKPSWRRSASMAGPSPWPKPTPTTPQVVVLPPLPSARSVA